MVFAYFQITHSLIKYKQMLDAYQLLFTVGSKEN